MIEVDHHRLEELLDVLEKDWGELTTVPELGAAEFVELVVAGPGTVDGAPPLRLPAGAQAACYWLAQSTDSGCVLALRPEASTERSFGVNVSTYFVEERRLVDPTLCGRPAFRATAALVADRLRWIEPVYERLFGTESTAGSPEEAGAPVATTAPV